MREEKTKWKVAQWAITAIIVVAFAIVMFFGLYKFDTVRKVLDKVALSIQPITIGLVIAYLLNPVMKFVEQTILKLFYKTKEPSAKIKSTIRGIAILCAILFLFAVIALLLFMLIPQLMTSITNLINQIPGKTEEFIVYFDEQFKKFSQFTDQNSEIGKGLDEVLRTISNYFVNWAKNDLLGTVNRVAESVTSGLFGVLKFLFNFIIGIMVSVYLLASKEKMIGMCKKLVYAVMKTDSANEFIDTMRHINSIFGGFINGKIIDSAIIGVLCFIGVTILRMPYPLVLSVIVGVTNVIPFFGPYIGAIPTTILVLLYNPIQGIIFALFVLALQQLDGNIIGPKILGDSTGLSSFWVIFAILFAGGMFGVLGMIVGVPAFASIYYLVKKEVEKCLQKKKMPVETECYEAVETVHAQTGELIYPAAEKKADEPQQEPAENQ